MTAALFITFAITAIMGFPIWIVLVLSCFAGIFLGGSATPMLVIAQRMFTSVDSFPLLAIPLFMVAGNLMEGGGISRRQLGKKIGRFLLLGGALRCFPRRQRPTKSPHRLRPALGGGFPELTPKRPQRAGLRQIQGLFQAAQSSLHFIFRPQPKLLLHLFRIDPQRQNHPLG